MPQSKFKTLKYIGKAIVLSFLIQFFFKLRSAEKRDIYQRYMAKVRRSVLKLYTDIANV